MDRQKYSDAKTHIIRIGNPFVNDRVTVCLFVCLLVLYIRMQRSPIYPLPVSASLCYRRLCRALSYPFGK